MEELRPTIDAVQADGQSTIEEQLAGVQEQRLAKQLEHAEAATSSLGTSGVGSLIDAAYDLPVMQPRRDPEMITRPEGRPVVQHAELSFESFTESMGKYRADGNMVALVNRLRDFVDCDPAQPVGQQLYPRKAIAAFQSQQGLPADGRYTRATHDALWPPLVAKDDDPEPPA